MKHIIGTLLETAKLEFSPSFQQSTWSIQSIHVFKIKDKYGQRLSPWPSLVELSTSRPVLGHVLHEPNFSKNPTQSVYPDSLASISDHPLYLIKVLILHHPPGNSYSAWPGILLGYFSQNNPFYALVSSQHCPSTDYSNHTRVHTCTHTTP